MSDVISRVLLSLEAPLGRAGVSFDEVVRAHRLDPEVLRAHPGRRIGWDVFADVLEDAGDRLGGPHALEDLGANHLLWTWPALRALVSRYLTPDAAFALGVKWFAPAIFRGIRGEIEKIQGGLVEVVHIPQERRDSLEFFALCRGAMNAFPSMIGWRTVELEFSHSRRRGEYRMRFARGVEDRTMDRSLERGITPEGDLEELMSLGLEIDASQPFAVARSVAERVRALLRDPRTTVGASIGQVARQLGVSERSLVRRLAAEGTSFRAIRDELRRELAIDELRSGMPIGEVAYRLGFAEPATFHRAFRRWTGDSPGRFKRRS